MGRLPSVAYLMPAEREAVDACIRSNGYAGLDRMRDQLKEAGIVIGRSPLHRYVQRLKASDATTPFDGAACVVVIMDRAAGTVRSLAIDASADQIAAAIRGINPAGSSGC